MTQTTPEAVPGTTRTRAETHGWWSRRPWLHMFLGGLGLWVATVVVTFMTENANLVPTIILLGSFLVPVTFVAYAFGHGDQVVTAQRILAGPHWPGPSARRGPTAPLQSQHGDGRGAGGVQVVIRCRVK